MANSSNGPPSFWTQADALLRKNLTYQKRNVCMNIRILSFPIIILLLFASMNLTYKIAILKDHRETEDDRSICFGTHCPVPEVPEVPQLLPVPDPEFRAIRTGSSPFNDLPDGSCRRRKSCPATILFTGKDHSFAENLAGSMFPSSSSNMSDNMVLGSSSTSLYYIQGRCPANSTFSPGTIDRPTCVEGLPLWRNSSSDIKNELSSGYQKGNSKGEINEIMAAYDFLNSSKSNFNVIISYNSTNISSSVNLVSNAFLQYNRNPGSGILLKFFKGMPSPRFLSPEVDFSSLLGLLFYAWIVLQLFPVVLTALVYERQQKLDIMMKMHGLNDGPYWMISYAYFLFICSLYIFLFVAFGSSLGIGLLRSNDYRIQFVFYFLYINLQISVAFLASKAFSNVKTASVTAYLFVFATGLVSNQVFQTLMEDEDFPRWMVTAMELYPGFSLYRGLYELSTYASEENGMHWDDLSDKENGMKEVFFIMFVEWIIAVSFSVYLNKVRRNWCLFWKKTSTLTKEEEGRVEKDDISQEIEIVNTASIDPKNSGHTIVCNNLKKVYPGKDGNPEKAAVKGLFLALAERHCFGMLGPNGAGKTTFISMMVGLTKPTSGTAFVQGLDIRTRMGEIYTSMGVCPQHDLLWETLTGREHLLFYGRLKNLKGSVLTQAVEESLSGVNLLHGGIADKQVKKYSGGMKRRLSVAISLIGNPKIVYMDEPSSGLDPASRYQLWNVVKRAKQDHAIMLTTHSMEEAEALCDRLGFMVDGRLQCMGTPNELKARYGGSYVLTMTSPGHEEEVEELVQILFPSANKLYQLSGTLKFEIPKGQAKVADVFRAINYARSSFPVLAWGVADTSLEDIFIKVCRQDVDPKDLS